MLEPDFDPLATASRSAVAYAPSVDALNARRTKSPRAHGFNYADRRIGGVLVFPDTVDLPPSLLKAAISVAIAPTVHFELRSPPRGIRLRERPMEWTAMPEAPIDENRHFLSHEHNISATP